MLTPIVSNNEVVLMIENFCQVNNIPLDKVVLGGGASLLLRGMREQTQDINLWIDTDHFARLVQEHRLVCHPMTDNVLHFKDHPYFWIRKYNPYFESTPIEGINCFKIITMVVHKRGSLAMPERPLAKRVQDRKDLVLLEKILSSDNAVKAN